MGTACYVWIGLKSEGYTAGNRLLGPYFLPPHLTGTVYEDFLQTQTGLRSNCMSAVGGRRLTA